MLFRSVLQKELQYLDDVENVPFGFIDNGLDEVVEKDDNGDLWYDSEKKGLYYDDRWDPRL